MNALKTNSADEKEEQQQNPQTCIRKVRVFTNGLQAWCKLSDCVGNAGSTWTSACSFRGLAKVSGTQHEEEFLGRLRAELQGTRFIYNRVPREANVIFLGSLPWLIKGVYLNPNHPRWKSCLAWLWFPGERWKKESTSDVACQSHIPGFTFFGFCTFSRFECDPNKVRPEPGLYGDQQTEMLLLACQGLNSKPWPLTPRRRAKTVLWA